MSSSPSPAPYLPTETEMAAHKPTIVCIHTVRGIHFDWGTFELSASLLCMTVDKHANVPSSDNGNHHPRAGDDSLWAFLPILVGLAATCLLMFYFISPSFKAADPVNARSARPGAETFVTR